jgi:hypothetical protein
MNLLLSLGGSRGTSGWGLFLQFSRFRTILPQRTPTVSLSPLRRSFSVTLPENGEKPTEPSPTGDSHSNVTLEGDWGRGHRHFLIRGSEAIATHTNPRWSQIWLAHWTDRNLLRKRSLDIPHRAMVDLLDGLSAILKSPSGATVGGASRLVLAGTRARG